MTIKSIYTLRRNVCEFQLQHIFDNIWSCLFNSSSICNLKVCLVWFGSAGKEFCNARDLGSILGLGRSPEEGKGYPFQYPGLENAMDCIAPGVAKSQTWQWLSPYYYYFFFTFTLVWFTENVLKGTPFLLEICSTFSEYAYRREIAEAVGLPNIPVHPVGYYDAQKLLE